MNIYFVVLDINECTIGTYNCAVDAVCNNTQGSYNCTCKDGFHGDGISYCNGINKNINFRFWQFLLYLYLSPLFS